MWVAKFGIGVAQVAGLFALDRIGGWLTTGLHLPLPGNLVGMLLLLVLLVTRVVQLEWVEATAGLFNRHLAFFFVPIAVGLLAFGDLFRESGPGILVAIIVGTAVGIAVTGGVTEWLLRIGSRSGDSR